VSTGACSGRYNADPELHGVAGDEEVDPHSDAVSQWVMNFADEE